MTLYANDEGNVHFYVQPPVDGDFTSAQLEATCSASGQSVAHVIELSPVTNAQSSAPSTPGPVSRVQSPNRKVRPALTGDPMLLSNAELFAQGLPAPARPQSSAGRVALWLQAVSKPATFVKPTLVTGSRIHGTPAAAATKVCIACGVFPPPSPQPPPPTTLQATSPNWSGFVIDDYGYAMVMANWTVPSTSAPDSNTWDYTAEWIGLDGWLGRDVLQDGTEQDAYNWAVGSLSIWKYYNYQVWTDWYDDYSHETKKYFRALASTPATRCSAMFSSVTMESQIRSAKPATSSSRI